MEELSIYNDIQNIHNGNANTFNNVIVKIFVYLKYVTMTTIIFVLIMFLNKIIVEIYNYLKKIEKELELNSAFINSLIEYNDSKNMRFDEHVNELKQHIAKTNKDVYKHVGNIEEMFYSETSKIIDCITNIELIKNNIVNTNMTTKINVLVEKINKYFEFFRELDLKKGEFYKKKLYLDLSRYHWERTESDIKFHNGFGGFSQVNPYEITPLLMKYFEKYYDNDIDKFYPLDIQVFAGDTQGTSLDWYDAEQERIIKTCGQNFTKFEWVKDIYSTIRGWNMSHIRLMNRNSVRLLDETDEEFEHKILQHILYELQDKYVIYKQIEFYTKPLEK